MKQYKHGFALGKFMPPHKGHEAMIRFGMKQCEHFTILVCTLPTEPIAGSDRVRWMKELFPEATVVVLDDPVIPQEPKDYPDFWNIWRSAIRTRVAEPIDAVFASEQYGWRLAAELNALFVPFDIDRVIVPTSGTAVRQDPHAEWSFLTRPVRRDWVKRVAILGPESVGKTTMAKKLAEHYGTVAALEYARPLFDELVEAGLREPSEFRYEDLAVVARGQYALEQLLAEQATNVLFTDTDVITTVTWSQYLYGTHEDWLYQLATEGSYDLTIILHPDDNEYVQDAQRVMSDQAVRVSFLHSLTRNLELLGRPYQVVRGSHEERFKQCIALVDSCLQEAR